MLHVYHAIYQRRLIELFACSLFESHVIRLCDAIAGDIGGYLGLLIGGSALTVIEVIDLVLYNALIKFMRKA